MKLFLLLASLFIPLATQAQGDWLSAPQFDHYGRDTIIQLEGRAYYADWRALWVADAPDAEPKSWVVADTLTGGPDWECGGFSVPPFVHEGVLYFVSDYPDCNALLLQRFQPGGSIEHIGETPDQVKDLIVVDGRFFVRGFDDAVGHGVFELPFEGGRYRVAVAAEDGSPSLRSGLFVVSDDRIYFTGRGPEGAWRIWNYDPVTDKASPVDAPEPRRLGYGLGRLVYFDERLFFAALLEDAAEAEGGIWAFDLATKCTTLVLPLSTEEVYATQIVVQDNHLLYHNLNGQGVYEPVTERFTTQD